MDAILNWPTFFMSLLWFLVGWTRGYIAGRKRGSGNAIDRYGTEIVIPPNSGKSYRDSVELQPWEIETQHIESGGRT